MQLIWQCVICADLHDMGLDLSRSDLVDTICDEMGQSLSDG